MKHKTKRVIIITGDRQIGKTTLCQKLVRCLRQQDIQVSGVITQRVGPHDLEVVELASGQSYPLTLPFDQKAGIALGHFRMCPEAMQRSNIALEESFPTQVFIVDELGPLELKRRQGWYNVVTLLKEKVYHIAVLVVRPELLGEAVQQLPGEVYKVVNVTVDNRERLGPSPCNMILEKLNPLLDARKSEARAK